MTFQTMQKDDDNRYKNSPKGLSDEICSIWLAIGDDLRALLSPDKE